MCMCRCIMQCLVHVSINKLFLDLIQSCRFKENSRTTETITDQRSSLLQEDIRDLTRALFSDTTAHLQRRKNPTCSLLSIARLQTYSPADLKHIVNGIWDFHHIRSSTQGIHVQRTPVWQLDAHSSTFVLSACFNSQKLTIML